MNYYPTQRERERYIESGHIIPLESKPTLRLTQEEKFRFESDAIRTFQDEMGYLPWEETNQ